MRHSVIIQLNIFSKLTRDVVRRLWPLTLNILLSVEVAISLWHLNFLLDNFEYPYAILMLMYLQGEHTHTVQTLLNYGDQRSFFKNVSITASHDQITTKV